MQNISKEVIAEIEEYAATLERGITLAVETGKDAIEAYFRAEVANARAFLAFHAPKPAAPKQSAQREASAPRCSFHREIRRAFAIMREAGLDAKNSDAMREAFARFLGREITSREELTGNEWNWLGSAIKRRELAW